MKSKRRPLHFFLILLIGAFAICPAKANNSAMLDAHYTSASLYTQEQNAGNLLNSDRAAYGLPTLTLDPELCRIARIKAEDMRDHHYFAHVSPTYGNIRQMLSHFGYSFNVAVENIAHHATLEKCETALLSSPGHRRNIMSKSYEKYGVGIARDERGYVYLVQIFSR